MRQAYKAYNITFTDSKQNSDHAYAAASRSIERRMLIDFAKEIGSNILIAGANITAMMPYILDPNYNFQTSYKINADDISRLATVLSVQARKNHIDNIDLHRRKNLANKENMEVKKKNIFFLLIKAIQYQIKRLCPKMLRSLRKITCSVYR